MVSGADPWKFIGIGLGLLMVAAVVTGMVVGSGTPVREPPSALPRDAVTTPPGVPPVPAQREINERWR